MRITVPDALVDHYQAQAPKRALDDLVVKQLRRFSDYPLGERLLILRAADREALETQLGASVSSPEDLIDAVRRFATIRLGGIDLPFTPAQLRDLEHQAMKQNRSLDEHIRIVVTEALDYLLMGV